MKLTFTVISPAFCLCLFLTSCGEKEPAASADTGSNQPAPEESPAPKLESAPEPEETPEPAPEPEVTPEPAPEPEEDAPAVKRRDRSQVPPPAVIDRTVKPEAPASVQEK